MERCILVSLEPVSNMTRALLSPKLLPIHYTVPPFSRGKPRHGAEFFNRATCSTGVGKRVPQGLARFRDAPDAKEQPRRVVAVRALLPRDIRQPLSATGGVLTAVPAMRSRSCFPRPYTYIYCAHTERSRSVVFGFSKVESRLRIHTVFFGINF